MNLDNLEYKTIEFRDKHKIHISINQWDKTMELTKKTLKRFPYGHIQTIVYGNKRVGKTIYLIKSMMEQYRIIYGYTEEEAFREVLKRTYFTIREFVDNMKELDYKNDYLPSVHIDDAGTGFSKHMWNKKGGRGLAQELQSVTETIGIRVIGLYFSAPSIESILSFLHSYEGRVIHIIDNSCHDDKWRRIAKIYRWNILPSGTRRIDPRVDEDPYSCFLKQEYYHAYEEIRRAYTTEGLNKLDQAEKNLEQYNVNRRISHQVMKIISERLNPEVTP